MHLHLSHSHWASLWGVLELWFLSQGLSVSCWLRAHGPGIWIVCCVLVDISGTCFGRGPLCKLLVVFSASSGFPSHSVPPPSTQALYESLIRGPISLDCILPLDTRQTQGGSYWVSHCCECFLLVLMSAARRPVTRAGLTTAAALAWPTHGAGCSPLLSDWHTTELQVFSSCFSTPIGRIPYRDSHLSGLFLHLRFLWTPGHHVRLFINSSS